MSIASKLQQVLDAKTDIKDAIEAQGVTVGNASLDQYAAKIGQISGGGGGSSIINFTINGVSYQADSGMEWYDWVSSSYNPGWFSCDGYNSGSYVRYVSTVQPVLYKNVSERPWNLIGSGRAYSYAIGGGSND